MSQIVFDGKKYRIDSGYPDVFKINKGEFYLSVNPEWKSSVPIPEALLNMLKEEIETEYLLQSYSM